MSKHTYIPPVFYIPPVSGLPAWRSRFFKLRKNITHKQNIISTNVPIVSKVHSYYLDILVRSKIFVPKLSQGTIPSHANSVSIFMQGDVLRDAKYSMVSLCGWEKP